MQTCSQHIYDTAYLSYVVVRWPWPVTIDWEKCLRHNKLQSHWLKQKAFPSFSCVCFISLYIDFYMLKKALKFIYVTAKKNYSAPDCVLKKHNFSGIMGSRIIHANVAINSSYAAHLTHRPSARQKTCAECQCGTRHGGKRAVCSQPQKNHSTVIWRCNLCQIDMKHQKSSAQCAFIDWQLV